MAAKEPLVIPCSNAKIFRPKPKRINKKYNIYQFNKKCVYNNRQPKQKNSKADYNNESKKNVLKNYLYEEKNKALSFNLDFISLEEIDKDFKEFKSKSEELEVQNELINLMKKADNEYYYNDNVQIIKRPKKPFCKNFK